MIRALLALPAQRRRYQEPHADQPWIAVEDRRLLRAVERMKVRYVEPWQAKPAIDWHARACIDNRKAAR